ncbi:hypothetical protein [Francisella frigiditurris]|uniref:Uncharacterized protein n=1 Tax=Francisella frigiditurris TaxID=1542390 RepID=A0A1J0KVG6_9GAMM|nr:hypothetical protein [Francisella frigiditurris]APC97666.1 hypothetical protein KX01_923 [Francisella frigiditurris]
MYTLESRLEKYKTKYQDKPKEKIEVSNIEELPIKRNNKIAAVNSMQQPQKPFSIDDYLQDLNLAGGNKSNGTKAWIKYLLRYKTRDKQESILRQYKEIYLEAYNQTLLDHQKANAGEFKANCWLRELMAGE